MAKVKSSISIDIKDYYKNCALTFKIIVTLGTDEDQRTLMSSFS